MALGSHLEDNDIANGYCKPSNVLPGYINN